MQNSDLKFEIPVKNDNFFNENAPDHVPKPKPIPEPSVIIGLLFVFSIIVYKEVLNKKKNHEWI